MTQFSKKLPIGIQTFSNLIREGYAYVEFSCEKRNIERFEWERWEG